MIAPRSEEHAKLREGKLTGSRFHVVMNGGPQAWNTLMEELRNPQPFHTESTVPALAWGIKNEPRAVAEYELRHFVDVEKPAFIEHPRFDFIGISPDGIVLPRGGVEVKCPWNPEIHLQTFLYKRVPDEYVPQVQGLIWVADLEWVDFISYDPRQVQDRQYFETRVLRDDAYIDRLQSRCLEFWELYRMGEKASVVVNRDMLSRLNFN